MLLLSTLQPRSPHLIGGGDAWIVHGGQVLQQYRDDVWEVLVTGTAHLAVVVDGDGADVQRSGGSVLLLGNGAAASHQPKRHLTRRFHPRLRKRRDVQKVALHPGIEPRPAELLVSRVLITDPTRERVQSP